MQRELPRIMIAATASGSGKTTIVCGLLRAFLDRGLKVASFKCGPDYIDPMFHGSVLGTSCRNLDTWFTDENTTRYLMGRAAEGTDIAVVEGVMGFYDGVSTREGTASSYDLAQKTGTPVLLVADCHGMSQSVIPLIKGFVEYMPDRPVKGVILNRMSQKQYEKLKPVIEEKLPIAVAGYIPVMDCMEFESRHLGLLLPDEVGRLQEKIESLAQVMEQTVNLDLILKLSAEAGKLQYQEPEIPVLKGEENPVRIGVAWDEAFCFYYKDNLELLEKMGAQLIKFSPVHDRELPSGINGLLLGGGYPELYARQLSENTTMRQSVKKALEQKMPCLAECGGFMYLHRQIETMEGTRYEMAGVIEAETYNTRTLNRFGYLQLEGNKTSMLQGESEQIRGHEYHYYESTSPGDGLMAIKADGEETYACMHTTEYLLAGFPHLYYFSNPMVPWRFVSKCRDWMIQE